ncbi:MAG: hypothetical protein JXB13_01535 [Phycisphaerae bacterium]|nr:hypothetical protein [Phycisphaerae bacterium]
MTLQTPARMEGAWAWSEGRVFQWGRGVTLVAGSSMQQPDGQTEPLGIRIQPDGTSPSYGVVLQAGGWHGVVVIDGILGVARSATPAASGGSVDELTRSYMPWRVEDVESYEGGGDDARP